METIPYNSGPESVNPSRLALWRLPGLSFVGTLRELPGFGLLSFALTHLGWAVTEFARILTVVPNRDHVMIECLTVDYVIRKSTSSTSRFTLVRTLY